MVNDNLVLHPLMIKVLIVETLDRMLVVTYLDPVGILIMGLCIMYAFYKLGMCNK